MSVIKNRNRKMLGACAFVFATSAVASGILISDLMSQNKVKLNSYNLEQKNKISINFSINQDSVDIAKSINQYENKLSVANPDLIKAVPNGIVTVLGRIDHQRERIVCLDKNNPENVLWYSEQKLNGEKNDLYIGMEYTPFNDSLSVLRVDTSNTDLDNLVVYRLFVDVYLNISDKSGLVYPDHIISVSTNDVKGFSYWTNRIEKTQDSNKLNFWPRYDAWGFIPVMKQSKAAGDDGKVTDYIIYPKFITWKGVHPSNQISTFRFSLKDNSIKEYKMDFSSNITGRDYFMVWSGYVIQTNNESFVGYFAISHDYNRAKKPTHPCVWHFKIESNNENEIMKFNKWNTLSKGYTTLDDTNFNIVQDALISTTSCGTGIIEGPDIGYSLYLPNINFFNKQNENAGNFHAGNNVIRHYTSIPPNEYKGWAYTDISCPKEIWGGYFANEAQIANGIQDGGPGSFICSATDDRPGYDQRFTMVVGKTIHNYVNWSMDPDAVGDRHRNLRIYRMASEGNNSFDSNMYSNVTGHPVDETTDNFRLGYSQGAFGLDVKEYNIEANKPFKPKIWHFKNNIDKVVIINQATRGDNNFSSSPSYGYHTINTKSDFIIDTDKEKIQGVNLGDHQKLISEVDVKYLQNIFNLDKDVDWTQSKLLNQDGFNFNNLDIKAKILINPKSIKLDLEKGRVIFDLYSTKLYDSNGKKIDTAVSKLKTQWPIENKINTFAIGNFKNVLTTEPINNININLPNVNDWFADEWFLENKDLRQIIYANIGKIYLRINKIKSFNIDDIVVLHDEVDVNNKEGFIKLKIKIKKFHTDSGYIDTNILTKHQLLESSLITLNGFAKKIELLKNQFDANELELVNGELTNKQWIFDNKDKIFDNSHQLTSVDEIINFEFKKNKDEEKHENVIDVEVKLNGNSRSQKLSFNINNYPNQIDNQLFSISWIIGTSLAISGGVTTLIMFMIMMIKISKKKKRIRGRIQ